jgi:phosphoglycerol transferase MdoB-like AlkP superfamily enzyme
MQKTRNNYIVLLQKLGALLALYALLRLIFYFFYPAQFSDIPFSDLLVLFVAAIRFDLSVIVLLNSIFIVFYLLPSPFNQNRFYQAGLKWLFIVVNSLALLANCVDLVYFGFTLKRTTADVFHFFGGEIGSDLAHLIPQFLLDYWYVALIWLVCTYILYLVYAKTEIFKRTQPEKRHLLRWLYYFLAILAMLIFYRGGFQLKPITIVDAGEYTESKNIPLLLNTPFTILKTLDIESITPIIYFSDDREMDKFYNPIKRLKNSELERQNVFLIVLESFSKEYVKSLNNRSVGYTPFLDSLIENSLVCTNAYSNGKKSIEGIPAIVASIPTWMGEAYITSAYGGNQIKGLPMLLANEGYYTAFFHGGVNGTMGFESFAKIAGYKDYFGKNEYNNEKDDDGSWGIWDEEFLQYTAQTINKKQEPFMATVFTLSSHHPFAVPEKYKNKFKGGDLPIHRTIEYTDYSLKKFFETIKTMPWYKNTLFVICADHTGTSADSYYINKVGNNAIPIIYFKPDSNLKGKQTGITQQIDIMPSVLDYIHYNKSYFSFGKSIFDTTSYFAFTYNSGWYQLMEGEYMIQFDGNKTTEMYNYINDSMLQKNVVGINKELQQQMELKSKAIIQSYQQCLIKNKMVAP